MVLMSTIVFLVLLGSVHPYAAQGSGKQNKPGEKFLNAANHELQHNLHHSPLQALKTSPLTSTAQDLNAPDPLHPSPQQDVAKEHYKTDEVLIKFKPRSAQSNARAIMNQEKVRPVKHYKSVDVHLVKTPPGKSVEDTIQQLKKNPSVEYAEPNYILHIVALPNDSDFDLEWGLHNTGQSGGTVDADIDAPEAWDVQTGSSDVVVAVIDTGVDYNHVDLAGNMWTNAGETPGDGIDNDGNGYIDDVHGINSITGSGDPMDDQYHGTHCAGTIAARGNNGTGVTGVSWSSKIMALKAFDASGSSCTCDAIESIQYMVTMKSGYGVNVKVSSNSWGDPPYSLALEDAIRLAGDNDILFIAAAGNAGTNNDLISFYPANYDLTNIVSVAASDHNDAFASFSCFGYNEVDVAAPGVNVWSTKPGNVYQYLSGTSMATPHVAGLCALICSHYPSMSSLGVKERLLRTVDTKSPFADTLSSGGRINAHSALTANNINGPFIYSLSPGATGYDTELIIEGSQFGEYQGAGYVTFFDNLTAPVVSWSDHQIVCTVPPGCQSGPVTVATDEALQSNEKLFTLAGSISGSVTKETSEEPIAVNAIYIYDSNGDDITYVWTDTEGHYKVDGLPPGNYYAYAHTYSGYIDEWYQDADPEEGNPPPIQVDSNRETAGIDFVLAAGGSIAGRVTRETTGEPIEEVALVLYDSTGDWTEIFTFSDSEGHYTLNGLPSGNYYVTTDNRQGYIDEWYGNANPFYGNPPPVHVDAPNKTRNIDFALQMCGTVTGRVTREETGEPLSDVELRLRDRNYTFFRPARTDSAGNYSIERVPWGDYYIQTFNDQGYLDEWFADANPDEGDPPPIHIDATHLIISNIHFALAEGGSIAGSVIAASTGEPLFDVYVAVYDSTGDWTERYTYSDSEGHYTVGGLSTGDYYVRADNDLGYIDEWYADADPDEGDVPPVHVDSPDMTPNINFALERGGTIRGVITDCTDPLITIDDVTVCTYEWGSGNSVECSPSTEADGAYEITGLPAGSYKVCATQYALDSRYAKKCCEFPVELAAAAIFNLDLCMELGGSISGTIDCEGCSGGSSIWIMILDRPVSEDGDIVQIGFIRVPGIYSISALPYETELWVYADWPMPSLFGGPTEYSGSHEGNPLTLVKEEPFPTDINILMQKICTSDADCDGLCNPGESAPNCSGSDACPNDPENDIDEDGLCGDTDNCPHHYNPLQEDIFPPQGNGIGDVCECEGDFRCDGDVDGSDASVFKFHFGRAISHYPCDEFDPCRGDFACDGDVDGTDAILFKSDFGRNVFNSPCPACVMAEWCRY
jgi:subtilisin family serine protease